MEEIIYSIEHNEQITACDDNILQAVHGGGLKDSLIVGTGGAAAFGTVGAAGGGLASIGDGKNTGRNIGAGVVVGAGAGFTAGAIVGAGLKR